MKMSYDSLSEANQIIHNQRLKISQLEAEIVLLKQQVAEETKMKYVAWKKLAEITPSTKDTLTKSTS